MVGAACMGIFWQQLAGIGHDLGHSGISHDFHLDHKVGSVMSAFLGLSLCWWKSDHNTHHVVCNAVEHDPNISHMPMIVRAPPRRTPPPCLSLSLSLKRVRAQPLAFFRPSHAFGGIASHGIAFRKGGDLCPRGQCPFLSVLVSSSS